MSTESVEELAAIEIARWVRDCATVDWIVEQRIETDQAQNSELNQTVPVVRDGDASYVVITHHEASHVVTGKAWGRKLVSACVRVDRSGAVEFDDHYDSFDDRFAAAVTSLAGVAFEVLHGADGPRRWDLRQSADIFIARRSLDQTRELSRTELKPITVARLAVCTVSSNLEAITRVAALLRAVGEVDDATVTALCRSGN